MNGDAPSRSLRLAVRRLKGLTPVDFDAVLDTLDVAQRQRTLELLRDQEMADRAEAGAPDFALDTVVVPPGISPWLAARINGLADSGEETADRFLLARQTTARLRSCAAELAPADTRKRRFPSLLDRLWGAAS